MNYVSPIRVLTERVRRVMASARHGDKSRKAESITSTITSTSTREKRAGFSLLEMLIALAIASAFLVGIYATFIQIVQSHNISEAKMDALRSGRAALATMSDELRQANALGTVYFVGLSEKLPYGDGHDNDGDGKVDDKAVGGGMDPNTSGSLTTKDDRHAKLGNLYERPLFVGKADLGDGDVDVDTVFGRDSISFRITPKTPTPDMLSKTISYAVTEYEGQPNVLVREAKIERQGLEPLVTVGPLAFGVLGLDLLYWRPSNPPASQGWLKVWDSAVPDPSAPAGLPALPASVYLRLTLYADPRPLEAYKAGQPVETEMMETVVNIEQIIGRADYPRPSL